MTSSFDPLTGPLISQREATSPSLGWTRVSSSLAAACLLLLLVLCANHGVPRSFEEVSSLPLAGRSGGDSVWEQFLSIPNNETLARFLETITSKPHIAGSPENFETAAFVKEKFEQFGLKAHFSDFPVLLSRPLHRHLALIQPVHVELPVDEEPVPEDPYSSSPRIAPPFLAYSPNGSVAGEVVYANYGRDEDFEQLAAMGVDCHGSIAIMRYGMIYRGDKVENAARRGAIAAIIYSDPADYARLGTEPDDVYPQRQWLPPSGAQRGSIIRFNGDPLTPDWPSSFGGEQLPLEDEKLRSRLPQIPALPLSYGAAREVLGRLGGQLAPQDWWGGLNLTSHGVGPGPAVLGMDVKMWQGVATIRNVIGIIEGSLYPDRLVIIGNHRDAWVFGAADPNSGTACLLEIARAFGRLQAAGWRPLRTLVFASWDAEEYALIGSTEWVEANGKLLDARAVVYLNLDTAVSGRSFYAGSTPQLDDIIRQVTALVQDPDAPDQSVLDTWTARSKSTPQLDRLGGGGSDFAGFIQHAGVAAADAFFGGDYPVYHSMYDNFHWMAKFGDPLFSRHVAATRIWGLLALRLSTDEILPFNYSAYALELKTYLSDIEARVSAMPAGVASAINLGPLQDSIASFETAAAGVAAEGEPLLQEVKSLSSKGSRFEVGGSDARRSKAERWQKRQYVDGRIRSLNDRLMLAERGFLDPDGLDSGDQHWYRHLIYAPEKNNDYGSVSFPTIQDALNEVESAIKENLAFPVDDLTVGVALGSSMRFGVEKVQHEVFRVARAIQRSSIILNGNLL